MVFCCYWIVLVVVFVLEGVDFFCDWLFYFWVKESSDFYIVNYGYFYWVIFVVVVLGLLIFVFEVINFVIEMFMESGFCVLVDIVFMVFIWVEDVFQMGVVLVIVVNIWEFVYWIQYVKVGWVVFEVMVWVLVQCVFCCFIFNRIQWVMDYFVLFFKFLVQIVVLGCFVGIFF